MICNSITGKTNIKCKIAMLLGITCTMPIIGLNLAGYYIKIFDIIFVLYIALLILYISLKRNIILKLTKLRIIYFCFIIFPIFSYITGMVYMPSEWHQSMTSYLIKAIEFCILAFLMYIDNCIEDSVFFAKGLMIGIILNAIWAIFQAITYYVSNQLLNTLVFVNIFGLSRGGEILNSYGGIRVTGFNNDPAHLGALLPILFYYSLSKRNLYMIILSIISLAFSQSTTALVGCIVSFFLFILINKKTLKSLTFRINKRKIFIISFIIIIFLFCAFLVQENGVIIAFFKNIKNNIDGYINRIFKVYINESSIMNPRKVYYTKFIDGLIERGPIVSLLGSGLGTSMFPFRNINGLFVSGAQNTITEIETNYIAYLFDIGIIGLGFYIALLYGCFLKCVRILKKVDNSTLIIYLSFFISTICCSALYHYIFTAYQMLAFSFATIYLEKILKKELENV